MQFSTPVSCRQHPASRIAVFIPKPLFAALVKRIPIWVLIFLQFAALGQSKSTDLYGNQKTNASPFTPGVIGRNYLDASSPLTDTSFNVMMSREFSYTVLGTKTPVSGFKLETSTPSATLSGNIFSNRSKRFIVNLELSAAAQNNISQLFSSDKLNGVFKASVGFNYMLYNLQRAKYTISNTEKGFNHSRIDSYNELLSHQVDTAIVLAVLYKDHPAGETYKVVFDSVSAQISRFSPNKIKPTGAQIDAMLRKVIHDYTPSRSSDIQTALDALIRNISSGNINTPDQFIASYRKLSSVREQYQESLDDSCISIFKDIWTSKSIWWLNIAPSISNSSLSFYDTTKKTISDTTSFLFSIQASFNFLRKYKQPNRFVYLKIGLDLGRINNSLDLGKLDYKANEVLNATTPAVLSSEKGGTAYKGNLAQGFGADVFFEGYIAYAKNGLIPGFYFKPKFSYGDIWVNKSKLSIDLGLLWNIINSDKTKNIISVVPYVSWSNILKSYKDDLKTQTYKSSELFSAGVKFGIPINIGN